MGYGCQKDFHLNEFHRINRERCEKDFSPAHGAMALIACCMEELGETAGSVLGVTGEKKRKANKTKADVLDGVADCMTYLSLLAWEMGCDDLETLLAETFNYVSERAGSKRKIVGFGKTGG
jgi:NTP pyrophosphatase (non-canonical NTP hydrolase)